MLKKTAFSLIELSIVILIIGILIAGVTQGSRVVQEIRFASAQSITQSSDVSSIPDLALWLETTSAKSFVSERPENGEPIATWYDINPKIIDTQRFNATQATSGSQPLYITAAINNLPALRFDGVDDNMAVADTFDDDTENATVFFVWKVNASGTAEMDLLEKWEGFAGYPYVLRSTSVYALRAYDGTNNPFVASTTPRTENLPVILSARRVKGGLMNLWVNGVKEGGDITDNTINTVGSTQNNSRLCICVRLTSNVAYCDGDIGEIIIFSRALKTEERQAVERYLGKKWGIRVP